MMGTLFIILVVLFTLFMLWLGAIILEKAGVEKIWIFCLLIPFVNILAVWAFAFSTWPNKASSSD